MNKPEQAHKKKIYTIEFIKIATLIAYKLRWYNNFLYNNATNLSLKWEWNEKELKKKLGKSIMN